MLGASEFSLEGLLDPVTQHKAKTFSVPVDLLLPILIYSSCSPSLED